VRTADRLTDEQERRESFPGVSEVRDRKDAPGPGQVMLVTDGDGTRHNTSRHPRRRVPRQTPDSMAAKPCVVDGLAMMRCHKNFPAPHRDNAALADASCCAALADEVRPGRRARGLRPVRRPSQVHPVRDA